MDVLVDGELILFGTVGDDFFMDGFTAMDVIDALSRVGRGNDVTVRINSGGGYASEGVAIFNALTAHRGKVDVVVEAIAASAASLIAMAGNTVTMRTGSVMMIHEPSAWTMGTSADHQKSVEALEALAAGYADIYSEKSGRTADETRADMKSELWLTPDQAIELGYADEAVTEMAAEPTAFDFRLYPKSPERLTALAAAKGWKFKARAKAERKPAPRQNPPKETEMVEKNPAGGSAAAITAEDVTRAATEAADKAVKEVTSKVTAAVTASTQADAAAIVAAATAAGVPAMAEALIKQGLTVEAAKARIASAKDIREAVALARKSHPAIDEKAAEAYIAAGTSIETVRAELFTKMAAASDATAVSAANSGSGGDAEQAKASADLWDTATAKVNKEHGFDKGGRRAA